MLKKLQKLNAWQIKLIITFLMFLNHLHFVYGLFPEQINDFFVIISRCVAPMFGYLAVEGIIHSKSKKKYALRLWIWTIGIILGNYLIGSFLTNLVNFGYEKEIYLIIKTNIFITLSFIVSGIICLDKALNDLKSDKIIYYVSSIILLLYGLAFEWGLILMPFMLITYLFRNNFKDKLISYLILFIIALLLNYEPLFITVLIFIFLYNGKRGPNKKINKYFFYVFYPIHLWIIAIVNYFIMK